jgi:uncharacterized membrane protein YebE (DUF533 family)
MFDTRDLLGAMLGSGMGGRNPRMAGFGGRPGGMMGGGGMLGGGGGLGGMLGGLGGGGMGGLGGGLPGGMMGGGVRAGGGLGGMQGALLGVLGGVALSALQRRMQQAAAQPAQPAQPAPDPDPVAAPYQAPAPAARPVPPAAADATQAGSVAGLDQAAAGIDEGRAGLLVRVMVAAANADMRVDEQERARILGRIEEGGASQAAREFVEREMRQPMSLDEIAREVSGPDVAAQVYAAALAAIDVDKATERRFLQTLAERTGLDAEIVGEIHDQLGQPRPA